MDELLSIMLHSDSVSVPELADKLHISEAFVYARLERYEQLGYVKRITEHTEAGCLGTCGSCKGCGAHKPDFQPSVYWIKGERLK